MQKPSASRDGLASGSYGIASAGGEMEEAGGLPSGKVYERVGRCASTSARR